MAKWDIGNALIGGASSYLTGGNPMLSLMSGGGAGFIPKEKGGRLKAGLAGAGVGALGRKFGANEAMAGGMKKLGATSPMLTSPTYAPEWASGITNKLWGSGQDAPGAMDGVGTTAGYSPSMGYGGGGYDNLNLMPGSAGTSYVPGVGGATPPTQGLIPGMDLRDLLGAGALGYGAIQSMYPTVPDAVQEEIDTLASTEMPEEYLQNINTALNIRKEAAYEDFADKLYAMEAERGFGAGGTGEQRALGEFYGDLTNEADINYLMAQNAAEEYKMNMALEAWRAKQTAMGQAANPWMDIGGQWLGSQMNPMQALLASGGA